MKIAKLPDGSPELFYTVQGEGLNIGKPSLFLRLSLCNLHCHWCDTPYTWNWENTPWETTTGEKFTKSEQIIEYSPADLAPLLSEYRCRNLVITGGEPLIQQKEIKTLLEVLGSEWTIEVETNGTIRPDDLSLFPHIQYNVSPKLSHSGNTREISIKKEALMWFSSQHHAVFKFVITQESDLEEIRQIQTEYQISSERIILMPEGNSSLKIREASLPLIEYCMEHNYRFSDRLHVHIWGNTRAK